MREGGAAKEQKHFMLTDMKSQKRAQKLHCHEMGKKCLTMCEGRMHRWFQMSKVELERLAGKGKIDECLTNMGHECTDANMNEEMVEFHVDASPHFQDKANVQSEHGGHLSVCFLEAEPRKHCLKPIIAFGQDKCVHSQHLLG